jgi:Lipoate-protein ligase A
MTAELFNGTVEVIGRLRTRHPFESFAFDDFLQHQISEDNVPKIRFWVHSPYIILGLQDARLPKLTYGLDYISDAGFDYIVRNSGGLGVVLDEGILNISLILPKADFPYIEKGYDIMTELVKKCFRKERLKRTKFPQATVPVLMI